MFYPSVKAPVHSLKALVDLYDERIELDDANEVLGYMSKTKLAKNTAITVHLHPTADEETAAKTIAKNGTKPFSIIKFSFYSTCLLCCTLKCNQKFESQLTRGVMVFN